MSVPEKSSPGLVDRARDLLRKVEGLLGDSSSAPVQMVALVRRRSEVEGGRLRIHYRVTLHGDNPFSLEQFGPVETLSDLPGHLPPALQAAVRGLRYVVTDPNTYDTWDQAEQACSARGAEVISLPNEGP